MLVGLLLAGCAAPPEGAVPDAVGTSDAAPSADPGHDELPAGTEGGQLTTTTQAGHRWSDFRRFGDDPWRPLRRTAGAGAYTAVTTAQAAGTPSEPSAPPPPPPPPTPAAQVLPAITGASFDRSHGAALVDAIAALPADRRALGVHGVDAQELLFASDYLCQPPHLLLDLGDHEASLSIPAITWFEGPPERLREPLSEACVAELLASGGDLSPIPCALPEAQAHFPEGSDCRACLEIDGDHARCVDEDACPTEATRLVREGADWYALLRAPGPLCAPDYVGDVLVAVEDLDDDDPLPETFDHGAVSAVCVEAWEGDDLDLFCARGDYNALGDVVYAGLDWLRPKGDTGTPWARRFFLLDSIEVEGRTFDHTWLSESGVTAISAPFGSVPDAWGINPRDLRPDGTDPDDPDHTWAREYVAAFTMKIASNRAGVAVHVFNRNRCDEDAWEGPHADGSWSCDQPGAWSTDGWSDDAMVWWWDRAAREIYEFPLVTLASTGMPDPDIPGGFLTEVWSSTTLGDAEWEACAWPKTFVPDRVRLYDPEPATSDEPYASFDGQTYRFGRDPSVDMRLVLATNQWRWFCPEW